MSMRMQLLGNRPTALQTGGQSKVAGLVSHPAGRHACVRMHAASTEDSNTDNSAQPDIASDSNSLVPFTQFKQQLLDSVALVAKCEAQVKEGKLNIRFDKDLKYLLPSLTAAHFVPEIMRAVNWQFHIWGDTTPVYCGVFQAGVMLGWLYVAVRGAGMLSAPRADTTSRSKMIQQLSDKWHVPDELLVTANRSEVSQALMASTPAIKLAQDESHSMDQQLHVMRVGRSRYVALGTQLAVYVCRALVQEYTSPAPGVLDALLVAQCVAFLAWLYFFIYYRRIKDQP